MGKAYQLQYDGQAVIQTDYNGLGTQAGHADDYVYAELFRLTPYEGTVAKGILPFGNAGGTSATNATVVAVAAAGRVDVNPFRAFVGSRAVVGDGARTWLQDIRTGISVAEAAVAAALPATPAVNSSGNPRWDLVYAIVTVDAVSTPVTRKVKNPGTGVVTDESVSVTTDTSVSVGIVTGTPGASPAFPAIPTDAGSIYYIPLAYIRVPDGFNATSTVANKDINEVAPILAISRTTGASVLRPANQSYITGGTAISGTGTSAITDAGAHSWTGTAGHRPPAYLPPSMSGKEERLIYIDLVSATSANWSHQHGAIVDDSIDWRKRIFKWSARISGGRITWNSGAGNKMLNGEYVIGSEYPSTQIADAAARTSGMGQSFSTEALTSLMVAAYFQSLGDGNNNANVHPNVMVTGTIVFLYVDASTGALKLSVFGVPQTGFFIWLEATSPYTNA